MRTTPWPTNLWPENVPHQVDDYAIPLFAALDNAARDYPEQVFTIYNDTSNTYAEIAQAANRVARFLASAGVEKGERIAVCLPNSPVFPAVFFGIIKAGAVCVSCSPFYTSPELHYQLNDAGTTVVFCMEDEQAHSKTTEAVKDTAVQTVVACSDLLPQQPSTPEAESEAALQKESAASGRVSLARILASCSPEPPEAAIDPFEDLVLIIYTAGTTGMPKGAALTHSNLTYNLRALEEFARVEHEPGCGPEPLRKGGFHTYAGVIPWYQSFGLTVCMLAACWSASRLICIADPRAGDPPFTELLSAVQQYRATIMPAVPTIFTSLLNHPRLTEFDLSSLMFCLSGGAPLASEHCRQFEAKTGVVIYEGYGLSETAPVATCNPINRSQRKIGTVGFPLPGTDIKILDLEKGEQERPLTADGEIAVCGPQVMKGYWNQPEANMSVFREIANERYFLTGDIGHIDEEGYVLITDRKKDMIIVGGFNVYPREVEDILVEHPKIELAAVVGMPDEQSGEAPKAHVQLKPRETATEEEIRAFCKQRLAPYKCPKKIEFRRSMPISPVGKMQRRTLQDEDEPL